MSTSESEDNDTEDDAFDDMMAGIYNDYDDDDHVCDFDNTSYLESAWNSIIKEIATDLLQVPPIDIPSNYSCRLAMNSEPHPSVNLASSRPFIDDSLRMYLTAPPLIRRAVNTGNNYLTTDPTTDESKPNRLSTSQLYVGNLPYNTKPFKLTKWFDQRGHRVSNVELKVNKIGTRYAFVRFDSIDTATNVLYQSESGSRVFDFEGNTLDIKRSTQPKKKTPAKPLTTMSINHTSPITNFEIKDIHYGTLITGGAMRNIERKNSIVSSNDEFGVIAHNLVTSDFKPSFKLRIDTDSKKLTIVAQLDLSDDPTSMLEKTKALEFEWNFFDLKARKIIPVLINHNEVFLLFEVKRPPIILETQSISFMDLNPNSNETRLPGEPLIGHANVWLFKLSSNNRDCKELFTILHRYNLTQRQFYGENINYLIGTLQAARRNLETVQLISNDDWVKRNQTKVDNFFLRRWPLYPFETKFEIMKLISKHIITVHDLIVDEHAEEILKLCTNNTLTALIDKILELGLHWFSETCDKEDDEEEEEDWDKESEQEQAEPEGDTVPTAFDDATTTTTTANASVSRNVRSSATGAVVNTANTEIASHTTVITRHPLPYKKQHLGTFSRFLICALDQLLKKKQLYVTKTKPRIYVTKLERRNVNANPFYIRKIYITPSTIFYEGPYREETCVVTREYIEYQDRFLRVTFRDEDYRVLHDYNDNMSKMYERIKNILINGVNVCDRHYQFLAFSSSQLREHSCWMFASMEDYITVDTIRAGMGDFRNVRPVAKYAARLGQSFSTSIKGIRLEKSEFKQKRDCTRIEIINGRKHKRCFTDGIGIITSKFAQQLAEQMNFFSKKSSPSAFQIRCGGYKGMVCLDVFNRIKSPDIKVHFRKSMNKFTAQTFSIDVVRTSLNPAVAYLNRQIILLLSSLGIPNETFISLQDQMLEQLKALTENAQDAIQSLKDLNEFGGNGYHTFLIAYLKKLRERRDPFVQRLLLVFKTFLVKELKTKAKIRVQDAWSLLGVVDESGTLNYGEVFIQIDNSNQQKERPIKEIFKGSVVVTRNPCFHPGDIRKLEAVDIPAFHNLKNVIVFPKNGPRSHAMEMSGGDLDGDTFWISRHPKLIFQENDEPFDYQNQEKEAKDDDDEDEDQDQDKDKDQDGDEDEDEDEDKYTHEQNTVQYTIKDVCNFFGEYIAADNLGIIANSHLALADQSPDGAKNGKCLTLARMHSVAVDFAKNGISAPRLTRELRPQKYPHYMEKGDNKTYHSETILGILYDKIQSYNINVYADTEDDITATSSFPYTSFVVNGLSDYMKEAYILKNEYDRDIKRIMRQYGIKREVELVSGYILKLTSKQYAKETKLFELTKEITHAYRVLQDKYLHLFWQEFYQPTDEPQDEEDQWSEVSKKITWKDQLKAFERYNGTGSIEEVNKKASAWFRITYDPWRKYVKEHQQDKKKNKGKTTNNQQMRQQHYFNGLFSFAWIVYPVLLGIFEEKEADLENTTEPKKRKEKKKKSPASSNENNE